MCQDVKSQIKMLLQDDSIDDAELISQLNKLILHLDIFEQAHLHGDLNKEEIDRLYKVLSHLNLDDGEKEHIAYVYFMNLRREDSFGYLDQKLMEEIIDLYHQTRYECLKSVIIDALKSDSVLPEQLPILESTFSDKKAFTKEFMAFKSRLLIKKGEKLSKEQVIELLELRAYPTLNYALDEKCIADDGLLVFQKPLPGEDNRKHKENLYNKANSQIKN